MIQSMTGYASQTALITTANNKRSTVSLSLKSLNSRFFELTCKLPPALSHLEPAFLKKFKNGLRRGHVYFTVYVSDPSIFGSIEPSLNNVQTYMQALQAIKKTCNINQEIQLDHILRLPNIFTNQEQIADEQLERQLMNSIDTLIAKVTETRIAEGKDITKDLTIRAGNIHELILAIEKEAHNFVERTKEKVQQTMQEVTPDAVAANEVHKAALFALLDKIDIHEEINRFKSHLKNLSEQLESKNEEKGKLLDFILQELGRENNTINAKCSDATISTHAINAKVEIEKMREQVQNIV